MKKSSSRKSTVPENKRKAVTQVTALLFAKDNLANASYFLSDV